VNWSAWRKYFQLMGWRLPFIFGLYLCYGALRSYINFALANWFTGTWSFNDWAGLFAFSTVGAILLLFTASSFFQLSALNSTSRVHKEALAVISNAQMTFHWSNPTGRVVNRFSKDLDVAGNDWLMGCCLLFSNVLQDFNIPFSADQVMALYCLCLGIFISAAYVYPISLCTFPPLFLAFVYCKLSVDCFILSPILR
jgi:hypothetical protein